MSDKLHRLQSAFARDLDTLQVELDRIHRLASAFPPGDPWREELGKIHAGISNVASVMKAELRKP